MHIFPSHSPFHLSLLFFYFSFDDVSHSHTRPVLCASLSLVSIAAPRRFQMMNADPTDRLLHEQIDDTALITAKVCVLRAQSYRTVFIRALSH